MRPFESRAKPSPGEFVVCRGGASPNEIKPPFVKPRFRRLDFRRRASRGGTTMLIDAYAQPRPYAHTPQTAQWFLSKFPFLYHSLYIRATLNDPRPGGSTHHGLQHGTSRIPRRHSRRAASRLCLRGPDMHASGQSVGCGIFRRVYSVVRAEGPSPGQRA